MGFQFPNKKHQSLNNRENKFLLRTFFYLDQIINTSIPYNDLKLYSENVLNAMLAFWQSFY